MSVDPLAEEFPAWNPYHYVHNNPVNLIDPTGMSADGWYEDKQGEIKYDKSINSQKDLDDKKIQGTFIDKSFVGIDKNNNHYDFKENGKVSSRDRNKDIEEGSTVRSVEKKVTVLTSKSIRSFPSTEVAAALTISQADSPAPGPADVFATLALFQAAISYFTNESYDQTIQIDFFAKSKKGKMSERQEEVQHTQTGNGKLSGAKKTKHQKRRPGDMGERKRQSGSWKQR